MCAITVLYVVKVNNKVWTYGTKNNHSSCVHIPGTGVRDEIFSWFAWIGQKLMALCTEGLKM